MPLTTEPAFCFDIKETGNIFVCMCIPMRIKFHLQKIETDPSKGLLQRLEQKKSEADALSLAGLYLNIKVLKNISF